MAELPAAAIRRLAIRGRIQGAAGVNSWLVSEAQVQVCTADRAPTSGLAVLDGLIDDGGFFGNEKVQTGAQSSRC